MAEGAKVLRVDVGEAKLKSVATSLGNSETSYCVADVEREWLEALGVEITDSNSDRSDVQILPVSAGGTPKNR